jgi:hypothetical protein
MIYIVTANAGYYPGSGLNDVILITKDLDKAKKALKNSKADIIKLYSLNPDTCEYVEMDKEWYIQDVSINKDKRTRHK